MTTTNNPPLPEPTILRQLHAELFPQAPFLVTGFTADQMRAYVIADRAARAAAPLPERDALVAECKRLAQAMWAQQCPSATTLDELREAIDRLADDRAALAQAAAWAVKLEREGRYPGAWPVADQIIEQGPEVARHRQAIADIKQRLYDLATKPEMHHSSDQP